MNPRHFLLSAVSAMVLTLFFLLPPYREWWNSRVFAYAREFPRQARTLDTEKRKQRRWENAYRYAVEIRDHLRASGGTDSALVLLPPPEYFQQRGVDFPLPEPAVFYYYTGVKTVWASSDRAKLANWIVGAQGGRLTYQQPGDSLALADSIRSFRKYRYPL